MIQPIIGKAPRVERDWESYSYRRSSRGGRKRNAGKKKERKERKRETVREENENDEFRGQALLMDVFMVSMIEH